jgi:hypothetical protein
MSTNPPTPLTPRERKALARFAQWVDGRDDPKPRERVIEQLTTEEVNTAAAQRLLAQLLAKGYLYEADGIRLTNGE